ncbi:MAG: class I SAM-dependent methyltransferase [Myxococcales bacterium]|nr:class I SAM-dependent methyltransferase [Myxococcales bacterium]MDD9965875.1 class I SAM-dependent methyltransferase [Myxococcales bacterium]
MSHPHHRFDAEYYERFYESHASQVSSVAEVERLARFVAAYLAHLELPVRRLLDMGCGLGRWRTIAEDLWPKANYVGVEISPYLCEKYGWQQGSADQYRGRGRFDLIVCQGVLQYLGRQAAQRAVANLARLCRGVLYVEVLTREDWEHNCDQERTDGDVYLRPAAFYREALRQHFTALGGGLYLSRDALVTLYELEKLE